MKGHGHSGRSVFAACGIQVYKRHELVACNCTDQRNKRASVHGLISCDAIIGGKNTWLVSAVLNIAAASSMLKDRSETAIYGIGLLVSR